MIQRLRVELRQSALDDLRNVAKHITEGSGSSTVARRFIGRIKDRCYRIGDIPRGGRTRDDISPGLRTVPFERSAVITYVIEGDRVQIVNVFYGGRDFEAILRGQHQEATDD
ncbi:type II toxin-antitoxin system RelE/ParE family toxin [Mesorhizobium sp. LHD-90]|uniref:type II toxin-antitoxin system RelE/ParE family toxin n=1 Tax=Mesorhizobium sp. LHD-90 TaxID=3071414 RepID=UPI0027DF9CF9|nr:type II toxin-antitoxin system RelE/ParE family toxin [Mesorhizobium sp. LHD-90]MDQ6432942.1 type II toxin-antitoxin system RelE/ParE family toxin [Mesorhizobium sp. LHD-90]